MFRLLLIRASVVLPLLGCTSTILRAQEIPVAALDSLAGRGTLLFGKRDGSFVQGKVTAASADSLILGKGNSRKAVARMDVEQVWRKERTIGQTALISAGLGALGGAFLELSLGSCESCAPAGDVLVATAVGAALRGVEGVVIGWLGGNWKPLAPNTDRGRPWDPWSTSLRIGGVHRFDADTEGLAGGFTGWKNTRPGSSWGFEYGMLSRSSDSFSRSNSVPDTGLVHSGSQVGTVSNNWAYSAICWRHRGSGSGLQGFVTTGLGGYLDREIVEAAYYDSVTAQTYESSGFSTDFHTGITLGGGLSTGRGDWRPVVEVRGHWAFASEWLWLTVQAGVDFH